MDLIARILKIYKLRLKMDQIVRYNRIFLIKLKIHQ